MIDFDTFKNNVENADDEEVIFGYEANCEVLKQTPNDPDALVRQPVYEKELKERCLL